MFRLSEFLKIDKINLELKSTTKKEVMEELASMLKDEVINFDGFYEDLIKREDAGSTAMEYGLAIPHVRSANIEGFKIAIGISKDGIDCESIDGKKTRIFFLIATNNQQNDYHLEALATIVKMVSSEMIVDVLTSTKSKEGLISLIKKLEEV